MTNKIIAVNRPKRPDPEKPAEPTEVKQEAEPQPEPRSESRPARQKRPFSKPTKAPKPKLKKLPELTEAQNSTGTTFSLGDRIQVRSPWGVWAEAEIDKFYQVDSTKIVAHFVPKTEREGWDWFGGCISAELLQKAP